MRFIWTVAITNNQPMSIYGTPLSGGIINRRKRETNGSVCTLKKFKFSGSSIPSTQNTNPDGSDLLLSKSGDSSNWPEISAGFIDGDRLTLIGKDGNIYTAQSPSLKNGNAQPVKVNLRMIPPSNGFTHEKPSKSSS